MQNYLEIKIPIRYEAEWFKALRQEAEERHIPVRWQHRYYHITVIFSYDDKKKEELKESFSRVIATHEAFTMTLDKIDAFAASKHVIYLTASLPSLELNNLIDELRAEANQMHANIRPDFRLHITLGKVDSAAATIEQVQDLTGSIDVPAFNVRITELEYQYLDHSMPSIGKWHMKTN